MVDTIVVFSDFSFAQVKKQLNKKISKINLVPYSVFEKFRTVAPSVNTGNNAPIVFIGRVSPYKGIELFLQAIALVVKEFPDQQFIIGGKPIDNYSIEIPAGLSKNITYIARHLENAEIANMVTSAQLVVCPYIEATQSGVIMTAYALECPVLVTNVGGLPEYVIPNQTGFVAQPDAESLARAMVLHLHENKAPVMRNNIKMLTEHLKQANAGFIPNIYNKQ